MLKRLGPSGVKDLEPAATVICYERKQPGEMVHFDIKKLARFGRVGHPSPNGKAERFIQTALRERAYAQAIRTTC